MHNGNGQLLELLKQVIKEHKEDTFEEWPRRDQIIRMLFIFDCIFKLSATNV